MTLRVTAPLGGTLTTLSDVPDPVFAGQLMGSGAAVEPPTEAGPVEVLAPIAGTVTKLRPHAFIVAATADTAILVHLGIDTVGLDHALFTLHIAQGDLVGAGDRIVTFDPCQVRRHGLSAVCPVVVVGSAPDSVIELHAPGPVGPGEPLFSWCPEL